MKDNQSNLLEVHPDMPLRSAGQARTRIGNAVEAVTCACMGWLPNSTVGMRKGECCPDAFTSGDMPVEIKSVNVLGKRWQSVVYDFRADKEREQRPRLAYAFVIWKNRKGSFQRLGSFLDHLESVGMIILLVPAWKVREQMEKCKPLQIKKTAERDGKRVGYNREGYVDGYRLVKVDEFMTGAHAVCMARAELWGRMFHASVMVNENPWSVGRYTP